jgi:hypothetical protein
MCDGPWFATKPFIRLVCLWMLAVDDELLAVAQELEFLDAAVGGDDVGDDLLERRVGAEQDRPLWSFADAHEDVAALLEAFAHQVLDRTRRLFIDDVEVERRHQPREATGIDGVGPDLVPQRDHVARDHREFLPLFQRRRFAEQGDRHVAARAELKSAPVRAAIMASVMVLTPGWESQDCEQASARL